MTGFPVFQQRNRRLNRTIFLASLIILTAALFSSNPQFFFRSNLAPLENWLRPNPGIQMIRAPDFCLTDTEGSEFCLGQFRGKVIVIDFMATWCLACEDQAFQLKEVNQRYSRQEVVFISISVDLGETPAQLNEFKAYTGAKWRFAVDSPTTRVGLQYESKYLPTLYVIDKQGFIAWRHTGVADAATLTLLLAKHV